jgi:hypothetical protein
MEKNRPRTSATYHIPGAVLTEREHTVPLPYGGSDKRTITVFTREAAAPDGRDQPYLVFLQGGPGFEATTTSFGPRAGVLPCGGRSRRQLPPGLTARGSASDCPAMCVFHPS